MMKRIDGVFQGTARRRKALLWGGMFVGLVFFHGCSVTRPPADMVTNAEFHVRAAHEAGAEEYAPISFRSAREKLEKSKRAMEDRRYEDARRLAESAQVDAELAEAQAEARIMRRAADRLAGRDGPPPAETGRDARQQLDRKTSKE
jgi:hypothetical protein